MRYYVLMAVSVTVALAILMAGASALGQGLPTTREAEDILEAQGLLRSGAMYLLEADLKLDEQGANARWQLWRTTAAMSSPPAAWPW